MESGCPARMDIEYLCGRDNRAERLYILNSITVTVVNPYVSWMFRSIRLQERATWPRVMADVDQGMVLVS